MVKRLSEVTAMQLACSPIYLPQRLRKRRGVHMLLLEGSAAEPPLDQEQLLQLEVAGMVLVDASKWLR
jgi:hypothetical protein